MSDDEESFSELRTVSVGRDFFETLGVSMLAGRSFQAAISTDSAGFVINETAWRLLAQNAPEPMETLDSSIGKHLVFWGGRTGPLLGIVNDFHLSSLHEVIEPVIFYIRPEWFDTYHLRIEPVAYQNTLRFIEETWQTFFPAWPLTYQFADQSFEARYRTEERLGQLFTAFALLALFIGCMGLFGLASFMAEQRTKEIGVRKVLGASVLDVVVLFSKDFTRLILIALVIAAPVTWIALRQWLEGFAYHITVSWWLYPAACFLVLSIAWLSVSYQSIQAAIADPVKSLRYE
jgi:ABC-type antimicrobial peptide transport system permease subunit